MGSARSRPPGCALSVRRSAAARTSAAARPPPADGRGARREPRVQHPDEAGSRWVRLAWLIRPLRVSRLAANWIGSRPSVVATRPKYAALSPAACWNRSHHRLPLQLVVDQRGLAAVVDRMPRRTRWPARSRPPSPASCPTRSRSARCARRRRSAPCCRGASCALRTSGKSSQIDRLDSSRCPAELVGEQRLAERRCCPVSVIVSRPARAPRRLRALHDERAGVLVERIARAPGTARARSP